MSLSVTEANEFTKAVSEYGYKELYFLKDLVLVPLVLLVIFFFMKRLREKQPEELKRFFLPGFFIKLIAIPLFLFHHTLIYKGGVDQFTYYWASNDIIQLFYIKPSMAISVVFTSFDSFNQIIGVDISQFIFARNESLVIKLTSVVSFFTGNSFWVTSILLSLFSYFGYWKLLIIFNRFYPGRPKLFAWSTIFIPSLIFWTCVISKEVFCIGAMGYLFYYLLEFFYYKRFSVLNAIIIILMSYLLYRIKIYILISLLAAFFFFLMYSKLELIRSKLLRVTIIPIVIVILSFTLFMVLNLFSDQLQQFALSNLLETVKTNYDYLSQEGLSSSRYTFEEVEPTISSILSLAPASVNVTLFRPYLWEANKPITLLASIESLLTLLLTIYVFFKVGFKSFRLIFSEKTLLLCFLFAIIFSILVGLTSGNFGTLMRYKIPMMPFYFSGLVILLRSKENKLQEIHSL